MPLHQAAAAVAAASHAAPRGELGVRLLTRCVVAAANRAARCCAVRPQVCTMCLIPPQCGSTCNTCVMTAATCNDCGSATCMDPEVDALVASVGRHHTATPPLDH